VDSDLDAFVQLRTRDNVGFLAVTPQPAIEQIRLRASSMSRYLAAVRDGP
ncbi:allophanate hydrolase, partial [Rhizobium brockwellii]